MNELVVDEEIRDFTVERKNLRFKIDDDVFHAVPDIAAELAFVYADKIDRLGSKTVAHEEQMATIHDIVRLLLMPDSAQLFIERMSDTTRPIGINTFNDVITWLMETYGLRPTEPGANSSSGPGNPESGTNLTVSTLAAASTSDDSRSVAS